MSDLAKEDKIKHLKIAHDLVATAVQVLTTRVKFFHEEFEGIDKTVAFLRTTRDEYKKEIEKLEPPVVQEKPEALVMDLTHVKAVEPEAAN